MGSRGHPTVTSHFEQTTAVAQGFPRGVGDMPDLTEAHMDMIALQEFNTFNGDIVFFCGLIQHCITRTLVGRCHHLGRYTL